MSTASKTTRRGFLIRIGAGAGAVAVGAVALSATACGGKAPAAATNGLSCYAAAGVPGADRIKRKKAEYVEKSPLPDKHCTNCQLYKPPNVDGACGTCETFAGPVNPEGYCTEWKEKLAAPG